jgi:hypothetical protein
MEQIKIQGRVFLKGKTKCPVCKHRFKYVLPLESLLVWDRYCVTCSGSMPLDLPEKGKMMFSTLDIEEWA